MIEKSKQKQAFSDRLNQLLDALNCPALHLGRIESLKDTFSVSQTAARKWLVGQSMPNLARRKLMAKTYGVSFSWLESGIGAMFPLNQAEKEIQSVPWLSWASLSDYPKTFDEFSGNYITCMVSLSPQAFATQVPLCDMEPIIPEKATIVIDPAVAIQNNDFVLAQLQSIPRACQWRKQDNLAYLTTLDHSAPTLIGKKDCVIGKIVQIIVSL